LQRPAAAGSRPSRPFSWRSGPRQPCSDTLDDPFEFELGGGCEQVHLQTPSGRRRVDALAQAHERDTEGLQVIQQPHEVFQVPPQTIKPPADRHVESPPFGIGHQLVGGGPAVLRAAHAAVHVLACRPATSLDVPPEPGESVLGLLVEGRDADVDGCPQVRQGSSA